MQRDKRRSQSLSSPPNQAVVLVPTYNERNNIVGIVEAILAAAPVSVWILDDNSPDNTGELADELAASNPNVTAIHRPTKAGIGRAYLDAMEQALDAGYDKIIQMDADFSHPVDQLPVLLDLSSEYDLVVGSRWVEGGGTMHWGLHRRLLSRWGSFYARTILGVPIRDMTSGMKCFNRRVLEAIDLQSVRATGYAFQIEMTYRALCAGFRVFETPIHFVERTDGKSKMSKKIVFEAVWRVPWLKLKG